MLFAVICLFTVLAFASAAPAIKWPDEADYRRFLTNLAQDPEALESWMDKFGADTGTGRLDPTHGND